MANYGDWACGFVFITFNLFHWFYQLFFFDEWIIWSDADKNKKLSADPADSARNGISRIHYVIILAFVVLYFNLI